MSGLQWYPRYTGDYARDTKQLSMMEHGAFTLLLDHYYSTGLPLLSNATSNAELMPDHSRLYRLCGAISKDEQAAVDHIIMTFFHWTDEGYINNKAAETIEKQQAAHAKRVNAGRKGGQSKASGNASSNAKAKPKQPEPEPEPDIIYRDLFEEFLKECPKQTDADMASKLFNIHVRDGADPQAIIQAVKLYASEVEGREPQYIKSAATFLSKKVYLDPAYNKPASKPIDKSSWEEWQVTLSDDIGDAAMKSWFLEAAIDGSVLIVKSNFIHDWIKNNYAKQIKALGIKTVEVKK